MHVKASQGKSSQEGARTTPVPTGSRPGARAAAIHAAIHTARASVNAHISDEKRGAGRFQNELYHPKTLLVNGVLEDECSDIMLQFFKNKRK